MHCRQRPNFHWNSPHLQMTCPGDCVTDNRQSSNEIRGAVCDITCMLWKRICFTRSSSMRKIRIWLGHVLSLTARSVVCEYTCRNAKKCDRNAWMDVQLSEAPMLHVMKMKITISKTDRTGKAVGHTHWKYFAYSLLLVIYCFCFQFFVLQWNINLFLIYRFWGLIKLRICFKQYFVLINPS